MHIPERRKAKCEFCQNDLDIEAPNVHQHISGWAKNRDGGGAHGVSLAKRENRYAHGTCVDAEGRGLTGQQMMFR
jgi:hypothetical protein